MKSSGTLTALFHLLSSMSKNRLTHPVMNFDPLIHRCLGCLHTLLMDADQRKELDSIEEDPGRLDIPVIMEREEIVRVFATFLTADNVNFQREACGVLAELVQVAHCSLALSRKGWQICTIPSFSPNQCLG